MQPNVGYIKLWRKIRDSAIWTIEEPFDKRSAWIDLLMAATYADREEIKGMEIQHSRAGEFYTSVAILARKWRWSRGKVNRYLQMLKRAGMIDYIGTANGTSITIENWALYQGTRTPDDTTDDTTDDTASGHRAGSEWVTTEEYRNIKKDKEGKSYVATLQPGEKLTRDGKPEP